ncbi:MAG: electron transfer flavoprotein subunit beta/FixA family protein [Solirubrobacterales bacterium]
MINIIACFKWVLDETYIRVSGGHLSVDQAPFKMSEYDRNALEEAVRLKARHDGTVSGVTVGPPRSALGVKDALSRGADRVYFAQSADYENLDPGQTARILAEVIGVRIDYDLILCGEGSSDLYARQVGPRLAQLLGIPCVTFVQRLSIDGGVLTADRSLNHEIERVQVRLPALVTVLPDINTPRIPGLKETLGAAKKPVIQIASQDLAPMPEAMLSTIRLVPTSMKRNCIKYGDSDLELQAMAMALREKGVLERR